jgi:hypothetical protein
VQRITVVGTTNIYRLEHDIGAFNGIQAWRGRLLLHQNPIIACIALVSTIGMLYERSDTPRIVFLPDEFIFQTIVATIE